MTNNKIDIFVYAHWLGMSQPRLIGTLSAHQAKGRKAFSFEYEKDWLQSKEQFLLDPDISWYSGPQFPNNKENFGVFMDSMPDTWGRTLMKRREAQKEKSKTLYDIDFLLGVFDESRMGALRFKREINGPFLDNNRDYPTPPWANIRELQHGVTLIESNDDNTEVQKWLAILMAPGSSLGGARPKANILDDEQHPWIAKFPSKHDTIDKAKWEYLAYRLAIKAGIEMSESKIENISGSYSTFFTKRFDRKNGERIHFSSAMTMTGNNEDIVKDNTPSYLDLAEFIQFTGSNVASDLHQLWRRMVFNIAISNTDDHLRNHGFILTKTGWILSPAYDINPSIDKEGLAINIDSESNRLDFELAISVAEYFQLNNTQSDKIIKDIKQVVSKWKNIANEIKISKAEQKLMEAAFKF